MIETPVVERESSAGPTRAGGPPRFFALHETESGALLAGTCGRGIARAGAGDDWSVVPFDLDGSNVNAFARGADGAVLAAAGRAGVLRSLDDGVTWKRLGPDGPDVLAVLECGGTVVAGTDNGVVVNRGREWVPAVDGPHGVVFRLVAAGRGDAVLAATEHEGIWAGSVAGGWKPLATVDWPVYALAVAAGGRLLAGTKGDGALASDDAGRSWHPSAEGLPDPVVHTIVTDGDDVLAGTGRGIARSTNGGASWASVAGALADHRIFSLLVTHDRRVLAGSYEGVWASAGGGWTPLDTGMSVGESFAVAWCDDSMAVAGGRGGPFRSVDDGRTWQRLTDADIGGATFDVCFATTGEVMVGTDDGVRGTRGHHDPWHAAGLGGQRVFRLIEPEPGVLLAGTLGHGVARCDGFTASWRPSDDGLPFRMVYDLHRSLRSGAIFAACGDVVDGAKSGGVFRSTDGGRSWSATDHEPITVYRVRETTRGTLIAGAQRSCVLRSSDGGLTWHASRPRGLDDDKLYCLAVDPADRVYLGAGARLLRSDDIGDSWEVVGDGLDGVTVYELAAHAGGTVLASTSSGMYRSIDAGRTFDHTPWPAAVAAGG